MLHLDISTPDGPIFTGDIDSVSLPTPDGEITVLPRHIPLISIVVPGSILIQQGKEEHLFAVSRGAIEVDGSSIRVIVNTADRAEALEEQVILQAKAQAEKLQSERRGDTEGFAEATAVLERELAKLHVVRRRRPARNHPPIAQ